MHECVGRFKKWLQIQVKRLEVARSTPSPAASSSVRTILVGHSMGGIVAAETLLSILAEAPGRLSRSGPRSDHLIFISPSIQGILAFDTPYLGVAPDAVAHSAKQHWKTASSVCNHLAVVLGWGGREAASSAAGSHKMLPAPSASSAVDAARPRYRKVAMLAAAAGAVVVGSTAAYTKKSQITQGVTWVTSHLEFVGVLARPEEMQTRLEKVAKLTTSQGLGFCNIYTTLGHAVSSERKGHGSTGRAAGIDRIFCNLPSGRLSDFFTPAVNDKAVSEAGAHMTMFEPRNNPGYYTLGEMAKDRIVAWTETTDWYKESKGPLAKGIEQVADTTKKHQVCGHLQTGADQKLADSGSKILGLKRRSEATEEAHESRKRRQV